MGCFNVACSVTNVSISHGQRVVFVPLLPNRFNYRNYHPGTAPQLYPACHLIYSNCYYDPFCFPIRGEYNDYGSIENVDRTKNVEIIEKFFDMDIDEIVDCIGENRAYSSSCWSGFKRFNVKTKELKDYGVKFDGKFLEAMGFCRPHKETPDYLWGDHPYIIRLVNNKKIAYEIHTPRSNGPVKTCYKGNDFETKEQILSDIHELTGEYVNVDKKDWKRLEVLQNLSGMFILEEVYDELCKGHSKADISPTQHILERLGFIYDPDLKNKNESKKNCFYHPEVKDETAYVALSDYGNASEYDKNVRDKYYGNFLHNIYELAESYIEKHGVILDVPPLEKESCHLESWEKLQKNIKRWLVMKDLAKEEQKKKSSDHKLYHALFEVNPFMSSELRPFENWSHFKELYFDAISKGELREDYCQWLSAADTMFSANVFFFPAMNGEQHGNDEVSKRILEKALEIVNERIRRYVEDVIL